MEVIVSDLLCDVESYERGMAKTRAIVRAARSLLANDAMMLPSTAEVLAREAYEMLEQARKEADRG